jgi:single-stranded DNA-binding protein
MTVYALVSGSLFRDPERKTAKSGKPYATATIRVKDGQEGSIFWRVTVFSESAQAELLRLKDGDAVSCQGSMKAELYAPDGREPRVSLSVVADNILALRQQRRKIDETNDAPKPRRRSIHEQAANGGARNYPPRRAPARHGDIPAGGFAGLDDDVPF